MTKAIKKTLLAIMVFGLVIAGAFSAMSLKKAHADYTLDNFIADAQAYAELANSIEGNDGVAGLSDADILNAMGSTETDATGSTADTYFFAMYNYINNDSGTASGNDYENAKAIFNQVLAQYNRELINEGGQSFGTVDLYSNLVTTVRDIYNQTGHYYSRDKDSATIYRTLFDYIVDHSADVTGNDLKFLKNSDLEWVNEFGFTAYDEGDKVTPIDLYKAEQKIETWRVNIANAIAAIKNIDVYIEEEEANATVDVWDAVNEEYKEDYDVLLASEDSINNARTKVNIVITQGDLACLNGSYQFDGTDTNHNAILTAAETALAAQYAKIAAVEDQINDVYDNNYSEEEGAEVCYTIEDLIVAAEDAYAELDGADYNDDATDDGLNNLKDAVDGDVHQKLLDMRATLDAVKAQIVDVETAIAAIGAVKYTQASKDLIDAARDAFDALPNDVKVLDNAIYAGTSDEDYCVDNYATLNEAEDAFAAYVAEVENLLYEIRNLRIIEIDNALTIYSKANAVQVLYNNLSDKNNQLTGDNGNLLSVRGEVLPDYLDAVYYGRDTYVEDTIGFYPSDAVEAVETTGAAYDYYIGLMNRITTSVKNIKLDIEALKALYDGEVRLTLAFNNLYNQIKVAIDALPKVGGELDERYKGAITNYDEYVALATKYEELLELASAWADAVAEIGVVSVNTFDKVNAAVAAFDALDDEYSVCALPNDNPGYYDLAIDLAAFDLEKTEGEGDLYSGYYNTYANANAKKAKIIEKLDEVKAAADALARPDLIGTGDPAVTEADYTAYANAVDAVTDLYDALAGTYSYVNPVTLEDVNGVAFNDPEGEITTQEYFQTHEADDVLNVNYKASYEKYEDALVYVEADEIELAIDLIVSDADAVGETYIADAREAYDAADEAVQAEVRNYETLTDTEDALQTWQENVLALLNGAGYDGSDVAANAVIVGAIANDNALKDGFFKLNLNTHNTLKEEYGEFTEVEKAYIDTIDNVDYDIPATYELLTKMYDIAGGELGDLNAKLAYIDNQLHAYVLAYNNNALDEDDTRYDELKEILAALDNTQRQLLENLADFQQIESDNEMANELAKAIVELYGDVQAGVTEEAVVEYHIIASIYEGLNPSQKVLVNSNVEALNAANNTNASIDGICDKVDTAVEQGTVTNADQSVITAIDNAIAGITDPEDGDIATAIAAAKTEIEDAYTTAIANAVNAAKTELNGNITNAVNAAKTELNGNIETAVNAAKAQIQTAYENAIANAIDDAKDEINAAIATAKQQAIDEAGVKDNALKAQIAQDYEDAINDAIDDVTELFNGNVVDLNAKYDALLARVNELDNSGSEARATQQEQIDELKAELAAAKSTATAALVVAIIATVAGAAAIVMIFLFKRR